MPHFHPDGKHLFVTWRLHGSLPAAPKVIYETPGHAVAAEDRALARSHGRLWLSDARVARQVVGAIRTGEGRKLYELHAWVVMPNHVHMLILPHVPLPPITHWIKGRTAREANLLLIVAYIEQNPVSAGLAGTPEGWPSSSATSAS